VAAVGQVDLDRVVAPGPGRHESRQRPRMSSIGRCSAGDRRTGSRTVAADVAALCQTGAAILDR
jgi:hypothetical protein